MVIFNYLMPCGQLRSLVTGGRSCLFSEGGTSILEDVYEVQFPFDGRTVLADATFVPDGELLIGTHLMRSYRLTIDFVAETVVLNRSAL
jgi:hypothetical protein